MAEHFTDISVSARYSELPKLQGRLAENADRLGIPAEDNLRLQLVAEEMFINTITHGYRGESDATVRLSLGRTGKTLHLHYEDDAPAFDPSKTPETLASADVGGHGLGLIRGMSKSIRYERRNGSNRTEIDL